MWLMMVMISLIGVHQNDQSLILLYRMKEIQLDQ